MIRLRFTPVAALALVAAALVACGDDDGAGKDATPTPNDGANVIEQSTVGNVGPYRIGVGRVDADQHSAVISIMSASGEKVRDATLKVGEPLDLADGALELLATTEGKGDDRDAIRIRFTAH